MQVESGILFFIIYSFPLLPWKCRASALRVPLGNSKGSIFIQFLMNFHKEAKLS